MPSSSPSTDGIVLTFGKHKGTRLTRVPIGYIRWMVNEPGIDLAWKNLARAEYERRGDTMPQLEISGHAIDKASLRVRKIWLQSRNHEDEGLYSWLTRKTLEAMAKGERKSDDTNAYTYEGIKFVIAPGDAFPTLKTIMQTKKPRRDSPHAIDKEEYFSNNNFEIV